MALCTYEFSVLLTALALTQTGNAFARGGSKSKGTLYFNEAL